ncbi:MAG: maleylpyruvate isomerase N-terminal domain-containing protein [Nocardioidaceae bacterium]
MRSRGWPDVQDAFTQAATWFVATAPAGRGRLNEIGLGEWTIRDLVGHTSRALLTVESYLNKAVPTIDVLSAVDYFRLAFASTGDPAAVAQRGRDAGADLGAEPADAVAAIAERVIAQVCGAAEDAAVATPVGGMRLIDYLPTRTFELTVHTCDLAVALDQPVAVPDAAAVESLTVLGGLTTKAGYAASLLRAATGRRNLPDGFTVL